MNDNFIKDVQSTIKDFIDAVGDKKLSERNFEKIEKHQKEFLTDIYLLLKPICKTKSDLRTIVGETKKKKAFKGSSKSEKIEFNGVVINELITLIKQNAILPEVIEKNYVFLIEVKKIKSWNKYEQWFGWALDFGKESYLATHIAKLTHSSSKGSSIDVRYHNSCDKYNDQYVCTSSQPVLDAAYPDNKYSSISQLYNTVVNGTVIGDVLRENAGKYLCCFTSNEKLLHMWTENFTAYIKNEQKQSYFLSKQVYSPILDNKYHLLLPLTSSSLVHAVHLEHKKYFEDKGLIEARVQKGKDKYSSFEYKTYPNKAYIHVTGSNHSNASSLNGKRGGRIALMAAMPPQWQPKPISYGKRSSVFDKTLAYELKQPINDLRKYLLLIKNKELSVSEPKRNAAVRSKLKIISDQFFDYINLVNLNEQASWTFESYLPIEQQLLFEPWREDENAKAIKLGSKWKKTLCNSYGVWLNKQLNKDKKLNPTTIHAVLWAECFALELRKIIAIQEVTI